MLQSLDNEQRQILIQQTADQTIKDFGFIGHSMTFSGNVETAYLELYDQILPLIRHLVEKDFGAFCNLLYRIDLHEEKVRKLLQQSEDFCGEITHQILLRELQKVFFRSHFKAAQNSSDSATALE